MTRWLGVAAYVVLAVEAALFVIPGAAGATGAGANVRVALIGLFFVLVVCRLLGAAVAQPARRTALLALTCGVALWAVGSSVLNASGALEEITFPSPGEGFFLASYAGMATFLLLDVRRRTARTVAITLETVVICGGAACITGLMLLPAAFAVGDLGATLFLALLFPTLDAALAMLVLAQVVSRHRELSAASLRLGLGFLLLAVADSNFVLNVSNGTYDASAWLDLAYSLSFALLSGGACRLPVRPEVSEASEASEAQPEQRTAILILAGGVALAVLALRPDGQAAWYVTVPAMVTLVSAGARLVLALREAQGATEAVRLSLTDELTGLGNRRSVLTDLDALLHSDAPVTLLLLDLDEFKEINDTLGHAAGDAVLKAVSARMIQTVPAGVTVARLGGDEFAIFLTEDDPLAAMELAHLMRDMLLRPLPVENLFLALRASIGITVRQPSDRSATDLLRRADVAMYEAKAAHCGALLYDSSHDVFSRQRLQSAGDLRQAIDADQLVLWYQPQIDAVTQQVWAVEALVRWQHPEHGLLLPVSFLPDARRSGFMPELTRAVVQRAVADARRWRDEGFTFPVSFNCAPPELLGGALLPHLFDEIRAAGLPPNSILVEVTEDSFMSSPDRARDMLKDLQAHHVQAAIDDYGTGFSSLAYIRDLPVQELKMDRSFVATVLTDPGSRVIVESTVTMAHAMGLRVVAEGVENEAIANELIRMGLDVLQGYHIARPMPADDVACWVRSWSGLPDRQLTIPRARG